MKSESAAEDLPVQVAEVQTSKGIALMPVPLNVTVQGSFNDQTGMALTMSVHPDLEDDATINRRIDRMIAVLSRQRARASIDGIERDIAKREKVLADMDAQIIYVEKGLQAEIDELKRVLDANGAAHQQAYDGEYAAWEENDGRRPFNASAPKVKKALAPLIERISRGRQLMDQKTHQIAVDRLNHATNREKHLADIKALKDELESLRAASL